MGKTPYRWWHLAIELVAMLFVWLIISLNLLIWTMPDQVYSHGLIADLDVLAVIVLLHFNGKILPTDRLAPMYRMITLFWVVVLSAQGFIEAWATLHEVLASGG